MPIILAQATPPAAVAPAPPKPSVITNPDWARKPTGEDFARFYPVRAQRMNIEGRAVIKCSAALSGELVGCVVEDEAPSDMKFGEAALKLSSLFRVRPPMVDGIPTAGGSIRIPIVFRLPSGRAMTAAIRVANPNVSEGQVALECWVTARQDLEKCAPETADRPDLRETALNAAKQVAVPKDIGPGTKMILNVHVVPST